MDLGAGMRFFVPNDDNAEAAWDFLRQQCGAPPSVRRLYSIIFVRDGKQVEAIVGRRFQDTGATVLAIFKGSPYCVWQQEPTPWSNPLLISHASIQSEVAFDCRDPTP